MLLNLLILLPTLYQAQIYCPIGNYVVCGTNYVTYQNICAL